MDSLPPEVLSLILLALEINPCSIAHLSKSIKQILDPFLIAQWFIRRYEKPFTFFAIMESGMGWELFEQIFELVKLKIPISYELLIDGSRSLQRRLGHDGKHWHHRVMEEYWDVLEDYKSERFGDWAYGADEAWTQYYASFSILKGFGIRVPIMGVIGEVSATLADETEVLFQAYVARLEVFDLFPVAADDTMHMEMLRVACLEPRLLPLMAERGLFYTLEKNDVLLRSLIDSNNPEGSYHVMTATGLAILRRDEMIVRELKLLLAGGLFKVTARVLAESFYFANNVPAYVVIALMTGDSVASAVDVIRVLQGMTTCLQDHRRRFGMETEEAAVATFLSVSDLDMDQELYSIASKPVLDVFSIVEKVAKRMIRIPSQGSRLLTLAVKFPFVVELIKKVILNHEIDLDLLPSASDPNRSIYTSPFTSPIAFDYENSEEIIPIPSAYPWKEYCYKNGFEPEKFYSLSIGYNEVHDDIDPNKEFGFRKDNKDPKSEWISLGKIDYRNLTAGSTKFTRRSTTMRVNSKKPDPQKFLPVAIALLDLFEVNSKVLEIVLMHSILNLNLKITDIYLKRGVPLRAIHLEALNKARPKCSLLSEQLSAFLALAKTEGGNKMDLDDSKKKRKRRRSKKSKMVL